MARSSDAAMARRRIARNIIVILLAILMIPFVILSIVAGSRSDQPAMIERPIAPGDYLRLRREAAGLSVDDVAAIISAGGRWKGFNASQVRLVEMNQHVPPATFVDRLHTAFRFDRRMFDLLVCVSLNMRVCRVCGCSDLCRCDDETAGECAWSTDAADTCTHCARKAAVAAPALPFPTA